MAVNIWVGGLRKSGIVARQYDETGAAGNTLSGGITSGTVCGVSVDSSGNVFLSGNFVISGTTHRVAVYDGSLAEQWKSTVGDVGWAIASRAGLGCYVNFGASAYKAYQFDGSGNVLWYKANSGAGTGVATDTGDNAYYTYEYVTNSVRKYDSSGTHQWSQNHGAYLRCVTTDSSGYVYVGGDISPSGISTIKYSSAGSYIWGVNHGNTVYGISVDNSGNVYTGGYKTGGYTTRKYNSGGSLQWSADHGDTVRGIAVDNSGHVYTVGGDISTPNLVCYSSSDGSIQWTKSHGGTLYSIGLTETAPPLELPGLAIPLSLGVPEFTRSHTIPSADIALALGVPSFSSPSAPPAISESSAGIFFRLYLSGEALLRLPMESFQCRRRLGESTWLDVVVPGFDLQTWLDIKSRVGEKLAIYAGYHQDRTEAIGLFLEATITDAQYTREENGASMQITARVTPTAYTTTTRTLRGVSSRGKDGGKRTAKAAVDFLVRPNDTVSDGIYTFIAGSIVWRVSPHEATMRVTESG